MTTDTAETARYDDAAHRYTVGVVRRLHGKQSIADRVVEFVHAYPGEEDFIPAEGGRPAQSRIFVQHPHGSVPMLIVKGSMRPHPKA